MKKITKDIIIHFIEKKTQLTVIYTCVKRVSTSNIKRYMQIQMKLREHLYEIIEDIH